MANYVDIEILKGKTLEKIEGMKAGNDEILFYCTDGAVFKMHHYQDCCENVTIDDVCGDIEDLIGSEIIVAESNTNRENPEGVKVPESQDNSFTWTFYKLATRKGYVDLRWYGESNGWYSEDVDFEQIKLERYKLTRKIEFRGKSELNGEWLYGNLEQFTDDDILYSRIKYTESYTDDELNITIPVGKDCLVKTDTVGQFTGLIDRNGVEIYEGDVLAIDNRPWGVVEWSDYYAKFFIREIGDEQRNPSRADLGYMLDKSFSVYGNIYDNQELLKGGEE